MYMDTVPQEFGVFQLAKYPRQRICTVDGSNEGKNNHDNGACAITIKLNQGRCQMCISNDVGTAVCLVKSLWI